MARGQFGVRVARHAHHHVQLRIGQINLGHKDRLGAGIVDPPDARADEGLHLLRVIRRLHQNGGPLRDRHRWLGSRGRGGRRRGRASATRLVRANAVDHLAGARLGVRLLRAGWRPGPRVILRVVLQANGQRRHSQSGEEQDEAKNRDSLKRMRSRLRRRDRHRAAALAAVLVRIRHDRLVRAGAPEPLQRAVSGRPVVILGRRHERRGLRIRRHGGLAPQLRLHLGPSPRCGLRDRLRVADGRRGSARRLERGRRISVDRGQLTRLAGHHGALGRTAWR